MMAKDAANKSGWLQGDWVLGLPKARSLQHGINSCERDPSHTLGVSPAFFKICMNFSRT